MIILKLQKIINGSNSDDDIFTNIAHYLLKRMRDDNTKLSIEDIASACFTSPASVSRFVRKFGYNSFLEFKQAYLLTAVELEEMKIDLQVNEKSGLLSESKTKNHFKRVEESLQVMLDNFDYKELKMLCDWIKEAETVNLYGSHIPGNITEILQHELLCVGKHTLFYPIYADQVSQANDLTEKDLVIVASLDGSFLMSKELTIKITKSKAKTVLITQNPSVKFSGSFDYVVALGTKDHESTAKYKLMMYYELLARNYYQNYS